VPAMWQHSCEQSAT